jgi:hypothetical protein
MAFYERNGQDDRGKRNKEKGIDPCLETPHKTPRVLPLQIRLPPLPYPRNNICKVDQKKKFEILKKQEPLHE